MHATDTLDFMTVLDGEIVLGLDDGEHHLTQGDSVIQRGNAHRWRVVGDKPCVYAVVMLRPDASSGSAPLEVEAPSAGTTSSWRRLVAGTDAHRPIRRDRRRTRVGRVRTGRSRWRGAGRVVADRGTAARPRSRR